ncbi:hypothetical protein HDU83_009706 [Entophlyctis luteolus]|nr:hypothetical protein HDU83_009706 [Entophlyctis luteolus]
MDLIKPKNATYITIADLKRTPTNAALFFDMLFDLRKYDNHIRRIDPMFREVDDLWVMEDASGGKISDAGGAGEDAQHERRRVKLEGWDKFAERAYEFLAFEETRVSRAASFGSGGGISEEDEELLLLDERAAADADDDRHWIFQQQVDVDEEAVPEPPTTTAVDALDESATHGADRGW